MQSILQATLILPRVICTKNIEPSTKQGWFTKQSFQSKILIEHGSILKTNCFCSFLHKPSDKLSCEADWCQTLSQVWTFWKPIYLHNICFCQGSIRFLVQCKRWWTYQSTLVKTFTNSLAGTGLKGTPDHHHQHRWSSGNICVNIILSTLDTQWTQVNLKPNSPCAFPPNQAPSIKTGGMFLRHRLPISCSVTQYSPADKKAKFYCICIYIILMAPTSSQLGLVRLSKLKLGSSELKLRRIFTSSIMSINGRASDFCSLSFIGIEWNVQFNTRRNKTKFNTIQYDMIITKMNFQQCFAKSHQGTICMSFFMIWIFLDIMNISSIERKQKHRHATSPHLFHGRAHHVENDSKAIFYFHPRNLF